MTNIEQAISHYKYGISHDIFAEPVTTYARLSIEALEKQIPQKVTLWEAPNYHAKNYPCPRCKEMLGFNINKKWIHYCPNCGQALDWSNVNE